MSLLYSQHPLVVNPQLAVAIGLNEAIVLQQIHYWAARTKSGKVHDGRVWIYNTYDQWVEQFPFWSQETIKRALTSLRKKGLIDVEQLNKKEHDRTNYYSINHNHSDLIEQVKLTSSTGSKRPDLTETTTETTTITPIAPASGDDTGVKKQSEKEKAQTVLDLFNEVCGHVLPKSIALNAKRQRQIQSVCKLKLANGSSPFAYYNPDAWRAYFHMILENPWNTGENPSGWVATIDYATRPDTVIKTLEKKYA